MDSDIDEEDDGCCQADDSMQLDITKFSGVQPNNETSQQTFLTWRPDIPFVNILHQSVLQGGVRGLSINVCSHDVNNSEGLTDDPRILA